MSEAIPDSESVFYLIHISALVIIFASTFGSLYIVFSYHQQQRRRKTMNHNDNIGHRLPYYLSIFDLCWSTTHSMDHLIMLITREPVNERVCSFFGSMLQLFLATQLMVLFFIALYAYLLVCREKNVNMGTHDWKLLVACFANAAVLTIIGNGVGAYGGDRYWCYINVHTKTLEVIFLLVIPVWCVFLGCVFLYHRIYLKTKSQMTWFDSVKRNKAITKADTAPASPLATTRPRLDTDRDREREAADKSLDHVDIRLSIPAHESKNAFLQHTPTPTTPSMSATIPRASLPGDTYSPIQPTRHPQGSSGSRASTVSAALAPLPLPLPLPSSMTLASSTTTPTAAAAVASVPESTRDRDASNANAPDKTRNRVVRRMMVYIGIFIYQYIAAMVCFTILVAGFEHWVLRLLVVVTINIGGALNAIAYGRGMRARDRDRRTHDNSSRDQSHAGGGLSKTHQMDNKSPNEKDEQRMRTASPASPRRTENKPVTPKQATNFV